MTIFRVLVAMWCLTLIVCAPLARRWHDTRPRPRAHPSRPASRVRVLDNPPPFDQDAIPPESPRAD